MSLLKMKTLMEVLIWERIQKLTGFLTGMQFLTIIVGTLTIIAGVIAISNILLITVKERTKEIGIRRALGAKPSEVRNQILLESVVITLSSGLIGFSWVYSYLWGLMPSRKTMIHSHFIIRVLIIPMYSLPCL